MQINTRQDRHKEVRNYLSQTCDSKMLKGSALDAIAFARRAYEEARREPELANPDPQLAAYRLGHLLMRDPNPKAEILEEIISYFRYAANAAELGPLPKIYLIAALNRRLSRSCSENDRHDTTIEIEQSLKRAISDFQLAKHKRVQHENSVIQNYTFNMLELVTYMANLPYKQLEGLGVFHEWLFDGDPCCLIETNPGTEKITRQYAKQIALETFSLNEPTIPHISLQFTKECKCSELRSHGKSTKRDKNEDHAELLAKLLRNGATRIPELERIFAGSNERLRAAKSRINAKIRKLELFPGIEMIQQIDDHYYDLSSQIQIRAIIEEKELRVY